MEIYKMIAKFSVYNFNEKEINQICDLVAKWATGSNSPIDARKYTNQVLEYAKNWRLICKGSELTRPWSEIKNNRFYINDNIMFRFDPVYDMPVEALWQMIKTNILIENKIYGHSVVNNQNWLMFNAYPLNNRNASNTDWQVIFDIFSKLAVYGFIVFQTAGNIWRIEIKEN